MFLVEYLSLLISEFTFPEKIHKRFTAVVFVFYAILFLENTGMVLLAIYSEAAHINFLTKIVLPLVFAGFILGVLFYLSYYRCYHPTKIKIGKVLYTNYKTDAYVLTGIKYEEDNLKRNT